MRAANTFFGTTRGRSTPDPWPRWRKRAVFGMTYLKLFPNGAQTLTHSFLNASSRTLAFSSERRDLAWNGSASG